MEATSPALVDHVTVKSPSAPVGQEEPIRLNNSSECCLVSLEREQAAEAVIRRLDVTAARTVDQVPEQSIMSPVKPSARAPADQE